MEREREREKEKSAAGEEHRRGGPPAGWRIDCHHGERERRKGVPLGRSTAGEGRR